MTRGRAVAVYGAGGFAREVGWLLSTIQERDGYDFLGYVQDGAEQGRHLNGRPVMSWESFSRTHRDSLVAVAVGDPGVRRKLAGKCAEAGFGFATLVHRSVEMSESVALGPGSIICCGSILTVDIEVGQHVHVNLDCTIGHDVRIGDYTTVSPGVHVSGNVHLGRSVFVGTGATILNGTPEKPLVIGDGTVIAAGACVRNSTEAGSLYAGVPAVLKKRHE